MIFTHGNPLGAPGWLEFKKDGSRVSSEYFDDKEPKGINRIYYNDKDTINVTSTTNKQLAPGWLEAILNNKEKQGAHLKGFEPNGDIVEGELDENNEPIKDFKWKLKEDGTHDKFKGEEVVRKKEGSDEEIKEVIETFVCNEKLY
jgi:hypothetical protein